MTEMRRIKANSEYECWKTQGPSQHIGECRFCNRISPAVFDFFEAENYVEGKKCVIVIDISGREYDMEEDSFVVFPSRLKKLKSRKEKRLKKKKNWSLQAEKNIRDEYYE